MKTICGTSDPIQNGQTISFTPTDGFRYGGKIQGLKESINALCQQMAAAGYSFRYHYDSSPHATIEYDAAGDPNAINPGSGAAETPTEVWELYPNQALIDVLAGDIPGTISGQGNVNSISAEDKRILRHEAEGSSGSEEPTEFGDPLANMMLALMLSGVRSFRVEQPTLKVSKLVSSSYPVKAALTNVGRLISSETMQSSEGVPATLLFNLPASSIVTKADGVVQAHAWYKTYPNVQQVAGGRWNISQAWEWGIYSTFIYGNPL
jgi:hypothetical protein